MITRRLFAVTISNNLIGPALESTAKSAMEPQARSGSGVGPDPKGKGRLPA